MTLFNCVELARRSDVNGREFLIKLPFGDSRLTFIDPWFGLARLEGVQGVIYIDDIDPNTECKIYE